LPFNVGYIGVTRGRTVTEGDIGGFAGLSGDFHQLHTNEIYAANGPFGHRIAHGLLVLSIATGLLSVGEDPPLGDAVRAFYGMDKLRFVRPTHMGDTLNVSWKVVERTPRTDDQTLARFAMEIVNQKSEIVVAFEMLLVLGT
jgi:acyl dehydratase